MVSKELRIYLNDHLAGATLGVDLSRRIESRNQGSPLGELMRTIAPQIEEDRKTLLELMERIDVPQSNTKRATGWGAEKLAQVKFRGVTPGLQGSATLMALESLVLGVRGKLGLWLALETVASSHSEFAEFNLEELAARA